MTKSDITECQRFYVVDKVVVNVAVQLLFKNKTKIGASAWQLGEKTILTSFKLRTLRVNPLGDFPEREIGSSRGDS